MTGLKIAAPNKSQYEYSWQDGERIFAIQLWATSPEEARETIESLAAHISAPEAETAT